MSEPTTEMPHWRAVIRRRLIPYRRPLAAVALVAMIAFVANEIFGWGLLGLFGRKSEGVAMLIGLLMYLFVLPTLDELRTWRRKES